MPPRCSSEIHQRPALSERKVDRRWDNGTHVESKNRVSTECPRPRQYRPFLRSEIEEHFCRRSPRAIDGVFLYGQRSRTSELSQCDCRWIGQHRNPRPYIQRAGLAELSRWRCRIDRRMFALHLVPSHDNVIIPSVHTQLLADKLVVDIRRRRLSSLTVLRTHPIVWNVCHASFVIV